MKTKEEHRVGPGVEVGKDSSDDQCIFYTAFLVPLICGFIVGC